MLHFTIYTQKLDNNILTPKETKPYRMGIYCPNNTIAEKNNLVNKCYKRKRS